MVKKKGQDQSGEALLLKARQLHESGNLVSAERKYKKILRKNSRHPDALHLLGLISNQRGNNAIALDLMKKSIQIKSDEPYYYNNLGLVQFALELREDAKQSYKKALSLNPGLAPVYANLAAVYRAEESPEKAISYYEQALLIQPDVAKIDCLIGDTLRDKQEWQAAIERYKLAIKKEPSQTDAFIGSGYAFIELCEYENAEKCFSRVLEIDSDSVSAYNGLAHCLKYQGNSELAIKSFRSAIRLAPDNLNITQSYANYLHDIDFSGYDAEFENDLLQLLNINNIEHQPIVRSAVGLLLRRNEIRYLIDSVDKIKCSTKISESDLGKIITSLSHPLLILIMSRTLLTSDDLEKLLMKVRKCILFCYRDDVLHEPTESILLFACVLAQQCFINDYVYFSSSDEVRAINKLQNDIHLKGGRKHDISLLQVILLAMYKPLNKVLCNTDLNFKHTAKEFQSLVKMQLLDPMIEKSMEKDVAKITVITDCISLAVRGQYEKNPYPRWERIPYQVPVPLLKYAQQLLPPAHSLHVDFPDQVEILIAGCGTGRHAAMTAQHVSQSKVLAVDLSKKSLAYAKKKAENLNINNIEFAQADILALNQLDKKFDLIESCGVLHHLDNPLEGWRVLVDLLKADGLMRIALYSEIARSKVIEAKKYIERGGYSTTHDDICRFRNDLFNSPESEPAKGVIKQFRDFYNTSECRDLLFHIKEHRYSMGSLQDAFRVLNMEFLGFEIRDLTVLKKYREKFPEDHRMLSLKNWDEYERQNPYTFLSMYVFWLRKS